MNTVSLVTDVFLSKREALSLLSETLRLPVRDADSAEPWLALEPGVSLHIEVPKFGEDLPLTLDLNGNHHEQVQSASDSLADTLVQTLGWSVTRLAGESA